MRRGPRPRGRGGARLAAAAAGCGFGPGPSSEGTATLDRDPRLRLAEIARRGSRDRPARVRDRDPLARPRRRHHDPATAAASSSRSTGSPAARAAGAAPTGSSTSTGSSRRSARPRSAVHAGDRIWWDYRDWTDAMQRSRGRRLVARALRPGFGARATADRCASSALGGGRGLRDARPARLAGAGRRRRVEREGERRRQGRRPCGSWSARGRAVRDDRGGRRAARRPGGERRVRELRGPIEAATT